MTRGKRSVYHFGARSVGEGKSTIAVNLAIALAATNSRVLLIDTDMRRDRLHTLLKNKVSPGFLNS